METREFTHSRTNKIREKKELLSKAELSIWLDSYDDIYSDFDPRPYAERALSDDFLIEAKKMARERMSGTIDLKLLMPAQFRQKNTEEIIVKNLHTHFHKFAKQLKEEMNRVRRRGVLLSSMGFLIMSITAYLVNVSEKNILENILQIVCEPAGWFLLWTGLDQIFSGLGKKKAELDFMSRMAHAEISFISF